MLDSIRNQKRLLFGVLLFLIVPSFVFFGVQGYDRFLSGDDAVATVDGEPIRQQEFDNAMRRQLERMRQMFGASIDPKLLETPEMRREVLDGLISQRVLAQKAASDHIAVSDAQLMQAIAAIPGLRKEDGSFDIERYRSLLAAQGMNEAMFEAQMRRDLATQALPDAITQTAIVPRTITERLAAIGSEVRDVREQRFAPADFARKISPSAEQLKQYYEQNAKRFETPETAKVEYVVLSADAVAAQIDVPAEELRAYYEQNKARYTTADERRARHILVRVDEGANPEQRQAARAKAEQLLAQVRAKPAEFERIAKAESQDPGSAAQGGDLGFFTRDTMVKPFADAAWGLKEGEISGIVQSNFGLHIIQLTDIRAAQQRSFEQVRGEIETEVRRQLASKRFTEAADTFSNLVEDQSDSLKPAADRLKLQIQTADEVGRQGAKAPPDSPLSNPKLLAALFSQESINSRRNTQAIDVAPNTLVAARIVDYRPAQRKPFEAVEQEVREAVVAAEARKLAVAAGEARLKELRAGGSADGLSPVKPVSRIDPAGLPAPAVDAVFRADTSKLPAFVGVDLDAQGYAVYAVQQARPGAQDEAAKARSAQLAQSLGQVLAQQELSDYIEAVKARSDITRNANAAAAGSEPAR